MAYLPPVNIPSLGGRDYARDLYGMISGVGGAYYDAKRDTIADQQWQSELDRALANDARAQANADRNYALDLQKFSADQAAAASSAGEYFAPQWAYNPGTQQWGLVQPNKAGGDASLVGMPDGYQPMPPTSNVNLGTTYQSVTTRGGVPVGPGMAIDVAGASHERQVGEAGGRAASSLGGTIATGQRLIQGIDDLLNDPMLPSVTGPVGGSAPTWLSTDPGGAYRAQSRIDYVLGNTFLQAYNELRGAGAITEQEGQAAVSAYNRLRTQSMEDADYVQALYEFRNEVNRLMQIAAQRAQLGAGGSQPQPVYTAPDGSQVFEE